MRGLYAGRIVILKPARTKQMSINNENTSVETIRHTTFTSWTHTRPFECQQATVISITENATFRPKISVKSMKFCMTLLRIALMHDIHGKFPEFNGRWLENFKITLANAPCPFNSLQKRISKRLTFAQVRQRLVENKIEIGFDMAQTGTALSMNRLSWLGKLLFRVFCQFFKIVFR